MSNTKTNVFDEIKNARMTYWESQVAPLFAEERFRPSVVEEYDADLGYLLTVKIDDGLVHVVASTSMEDFDRHIVTATCLNSRREGLGDFGVNIDTEDFFERFAGSYADVLSNTEAIAERAMEALAGDTESMAYASRFEIGRWGVEFSTCENAEGITLSRVAELVIDCEDAMESVARDVGPSLWRAVYDEMDAEEVEDLEALLVEYAGLSGDD